MQLTDTWYAVELSSNLKQKPISIELFESKICLWRDQKGFPHAIVDRCPHKGAALSKGKVLGDQLQCPYHGWIYDKQGKCVTIPAALPEQAIPKKACVQTFDCKEQRGLIFLWWGNSEPEPLPDLNLVPNSDDSNWRVLEGEAIWEAHWIRALEGFTDLTHVPFVHSGSFGNSSDARVLPTKKSITPYCLSQTILTPRDREYRKNQRWSINQLLPFNKKKENQPEEVAAVEANEVSESEGAQYVELWLPNIVFIRVVFSDFQIYLLLVSVPISGQRTRNIWKHFRSFLKTPLADNNARNRVIKFLQEDQHIIESIEPHCPSLEQPKDLLHDTDVVTIELRKLLRKKGKNGFLQEYDATLSKNT